MASSRRGNPATAAERTAIYRKAQRHLGRRDPVLRQLIKAIGPCTLWHDPNHFATLARSIISQQISARAAIAIGVRLEQALGRAGVTAAGIRAASDETLRAAGLSAAKNRALRDLAEKVQSGAVPLHRLHRADDDEVIDCLLPVRGIGRWTAQMFLVFSLGRLDVLPVDDFGLRAGVRKQYGLADLPGKAELTELAEPWRPYRTVGTWYIWRSLGSVPQSDSRQP